MEVHKVMTAPARFKSVSGSPLVEIHPHTGADDQAADAFYSWLKNGQRTTDSVGWFTYIANLSLTEMPFQEGCQTFLLQ